MSAKSPGIATASRNPVQSLDRAFGLLQHIAASESGRGMTLGELSAAVGLANSTAHRLLMSLKHSDFVEFDEQTGHWSVGVNAFVVGSAFLRKRDIVVQARPIMQQLVDDIGETSNLAILKGDQHVFIGQVECNEVMRMVVALGTRGHLHAAGVGKALLADLPVDTAKQIIQRTGLPGLSENTITSKHSFFKELERVAEQGYALDNEEQTPGMRCIAAAVYDELGQATAAVSISGPSVRVSLKRVPEIAGRVKKAAGEITAVIGGIKRGNS